MMLLIVVTLTLYLIVVGCMLALSGHLAEMECERRRQRSIEEDLADFIREMKEGGRWNGYL